MPRKYKSRILIEERMPDGGYIELPGTKKRNFQTVTEAEEYINDRIQIGDVWRVARVTAVYYINQELVKR